VDHKRVITHIAILRCDRFPVAGLHASIGAVAALNDHIFKALDAY
jgi:hypothetical protein